MQVRAVYGFQATSQLATLTKYSTDMVMDDFTKLVSLFWVKSGVACIIFVMNNPVAVCKQCWFAFI